MDKKNAICKYLRRYHKGKLNAIHSKELEQLFCVSDSTLRRKISRLRQDGCPICSDINGYYYAESRNELSDTMCRFEKVIIKLSNVRNGMLYASFSEVDKDDITVEVSVNLKCKEG